MQITMAAMTSPEVEAFLIDHPHKMLELFNITTDKLVIVNDLLVLLHNQTTRCI